MRWTVEVTDQFEGWWDQLSEDEHVSVDTMIHVLETHGPELSPHYSSRASGSRHTELLQLRVPHEERSICVLYIVNVPRSTVVLLTGTTLGSADEPCPPEHIEQAEEIYGRYRTAPGPTD